MAGEDVDATVDPGRDAVASGAKRDRVAPSQADHAGTRDALGGGRVRAVEDDDQPTTVDQRRELVTAAEEKCRIACAGHTVRVGAEPPRGTSGERMTGSPPHEE